MKKKKILILIKEYDEMLQNDLIMKMINKSSLKS